MHAHTAWLLSNDHFMNVLKAFHWKVPAPLTDVANHFKQSLGVQFPNVELSQCSKFPAFQCSNVSMSQFPSLPAC